MELADLIRKRKADLQLSYQALADRSTDAGHPITRARIHSYVQTDMKEWPRPDRIAGLAVALEVPPADVIDAIAESLGITVQRAETDTPSMRAWLALTGDRTEEEVEHLLTAARAVAAALDHGGPKRTRK